nr:RNA-binding S4 domain-containing protein [Mesobacterium pallidum]
MDAAPQQRQRVDKWLWQARFFKTRSLSAKVVSGGHCRVNAEKVLKPAAPVGPGDVLTFTQGNRVRVVRIEGIGTRRGPAVEAQALYTDLTPPDEPRPVRVGPRPTKKDRREIDQLKGEGDPGESPR